MAGGEVGGTFLLYFTAFSIAEVSGGVKVFFTNQDW